LIVDAIFSLYQACLFDKNVYIYLYALYEKHSLLLKNLIKNMFYVKSYENIHNFLKF